MLRASFLTKHMRMSHRLTLDLEKILIGVGVGLGTLAFFCAIALIITCCG